MDLFLHSSSLVGKVSSNVGREAVNEGEGKSSDIRVKSKLVASGGQGRQSLHWNQPPN